MPKICYKKKKFRYEAMSVIAQANEILNEYERQGFDLTLRQLYYQFVSRGLIANKQAEYNRLGNIVNDARLAGYIDWNHIVDRTRNLEEIPTWDSPASIVRAAAHSFQIDKWEDQNFRLEVWIEKDALLGVIEGVCKELNVPHFSCRGYTSQSEMWACGQRFKKYIHDGQDVRILHLGDHDPSGIDMTRDIEDRISLFLASHAYWGEVESPAIDSRISDSREVFGYVQDRFKVDRLALNWDQVEQYDPPPNPAKLSDSRAQNYIARFGDESWELDALSPDVLANLIRDAVDGYKDHDLWSEAEARENEMISTLEGVSRRWDDVKAFLTN